MKTFRFLFLITGLLGVLSFSSCVEDQDYNIPEVSENEPDINPDAITTFNALVNRYDQAVADGESIVVFEDDNELIIEGYVISSDKSGNFYKELFIQSTADSIGTDENPRLGFRLNIDVTSLYGTFDFGRKVYIKLTDGNPDSSFNPLALGVSNGVFTIGSPNGTEIDRIASTDYRKHVIRSTTKASITPKVTTPGALRSEDLNTFIQFDNTQFIKSDLGKTYAGEASDEFDGTRTIENCIDKSMMSLESSTFASFKSYRVKQGVGSISGIYTKNYFGDADVFVINQLSDIDFAGEDERCDPIEISCGNVNSSGSNNLFSEDFENLPSSGPISGNGWTNYIEAGTESWESYSSGSGSASIGVSARVGSYKSGDDSSVAWLISPAIDIANNSGVTLKFKSSNSFADSSDMKVLGSTDWDGTEAGIGTATWGVIKDAYVVSDSDFYVEWFDSGIVDLSCVEGDTLHFAFKYTGSGESEYDGTYEIDEISVDAE